MTIMVTGAAGYLGSYVCDVLLEAGDRVVGLDNLAWGIPEHVERFADDDRFVFVQADIGDTDAVTAAIITHGVTEIYHLAALHFIPAAVRNPSLAVGINVLGTQSMLDAVRRAAAEGHRVERFAFASTGDVYAPADEAHRIDGEIGPFNIYGLSKLQGEQLIALADRDLDTTFLVSRFFNLYGARETNPHIVPEIVDQLREGTGELLLGNLEPRRDMVPIDQAAKALVEATRAAAPGVTTVNIGTGVAHTMQSVVDTLVELAGTETTVGTDPAKVRASERMHLQADTGPLEALIGWAPSGDLEAGIKKLLVDEGF
ncbi:MAG: NAD-dependent epimerase/dehydratase family protein [Acidimicrobiales bacterium]